MSAVSVTRKKPIVHERHLRIGCKLMTVKAAMVVPVQVWKWNVLSDYGVGVNNLA